MQSYDYFFNCRHLFLFSVSVNYVWDNGKVVQGNYVTEVLGIPIETPTYYEYEGDKLVHSYIVGLGDTLHHYYEYDGDRLKTMTEGGIVTTVKSYDKNGNITCFETLLESGNSVTYEVEWKDGDGVSSTTTKHIVERDSTSVEHITYTHDNYPSAYSHFPIALAAESANTLAIRGSKHNLLVEGYTNEYKSGRLVRTTTRGDVKLSYYYTDGVGPDAE